MKSLLPLYASLLLGSMSASAQTTRVQRAVGGFLPGDYFNNCHCGARYLGHKHSAQCETCGKCYEDEMLTGSSMREVTLNDHGHAIAVAHVDIGDLHYGKDSLGPVNIGHIEYMGHQLPYERLTAADILTDSQTRAYDTRPIVLVGGEPVGRLVNYLNQHWPEPFPVDAELAKFSVAIREMEESWIHCNFYNGEDRPNRQRWKARVGQYENAHVKRRKANKAAKKARKKSRK